MKLDYANHGVYLLFSSSPISGGPACRVLGPFKIVKFAAKGLWAYELGREPLRLATQTDLCWEIDGLDDPPWGDVRVIAPGEPTSARAIEADNDWIRPV